MRNSKVWLASLTLFASVGITAPAAAQAIISENFNTGFGVFTVESTTIARNTARPGYQVCCGVTGSDANLDNPFVAFGSGNATNRGSILTEFASVAGQAYNLTFRFGALGSGMDNLTYTVGGFSQQLVATGGNNIDTAFTTYSYNFVGTGNPTLLSFSTRGPGTNVDAILDDVTLSAVPEPATWGMMIVGFGAVGGAIRSRRRKALAALATA